MTDQMRGHHTEVEVDQANTNPARETLADELASVFRRYVEPPARVLEIAPNGPSGSLLLAQMG